MDSNAKGLMIGVSELHPLRAQWKDPTIGRFTSFDSFEASVENPTHLHKYNYAGADPVNNVDPSGNDFSYVGLLKSIGIGAVLGGISGGVYAKLTNRSVFKGVLIGAGLGAAAGAGIYLAWTGIAAGKSGALARFFWNPSTFRTISQQYWQRFGPSNGASLHHWLLPQRLGSVLPQGIINAGCNCLASLPHLPVRSA